MNSSPQLESKALTEFMPFSRLPFELQARIFKEAQPDPVVTDLFFMTDANDRRFISRLPRYGELNSLLLACKESHAEIFRRFQKFEIVVPPLFDDYIGELHGYFRPVIDILIVKATRILPLYDFGGSLTFKNITQLAFDDTMEESWYSAQTILTTRMNQAAKLYTLLSNHCPALSNLWVVVDTHWHGMYYPSSDHLRRMLDISDGLTDLDLRVKYDPGLRDLQKELQDLSFHIQMKAIKEHVDMIARDFNRFLNTKEDDPWPAPGEAASRHWETCRPTPALMCLISKYESGSLIHRYKVGHIGISPWLWVPALRVNIRCHKDGTPVHKYKGLAQTFDGEPW